MRTGEHNSGHISEFRSLLKENLALEPLRRFWNEDRKLCARVFFNIFEFQDYVLRQVSEPQERRAAPVKEAHVMVQLGADIRKDCLAIYTFITIDTERRKFRTESEKAIGRKGWNRCSSVKQTLVYTRKRPFDLMSLLNCQNKHCIQVLWYFVRGSLLKVVYGIKKKAESRE